MTTTVPVPGAVHRTTTAAAAAMAVPCRRQGRIGLPVHPGPPSASPVNRQPVAPGQASGRLEPAPSSVPSDTQTRASCQQQQQQLEGQEQRESAATSAPRRLSAKRNATRWPEAGRCRWPVGSGAGEGQGNSSGSGSTSSTGPSSNGLDWKLRRTVGGKSPSDREPIVGGSLRAWCPRARGRILIKANSSTGIYQLAGGAETLERNDERTDLGARPDAAQNPATAEAETTPRPPDGERTTTEASDTGSGSGEAPRTGLVLSRTTRTSPRKPPPIAGCERSPVAIGNYENIRPRETVSRTLGSAYRKSATNRRKGTVSGGTPERRSRPPRHGESEADEERLSVSLPHNSTGDGDSGEFHWQQQAQHQMPSAVPTRFFQRQDYARPTAAPTEEYAREHLMAATRQDSCRSKTLLSGGSGRKRWLASVGTTGGHRKPVASQPIGMESNDGAPSSTGTSFRLVPPFFGTAGSGSRRSSERSMLKNVNLHFPNKTGHQQGRASEVGLADRSGQLHAASQAYQQLLYPNARPALATGPGKRTSGERKYFSKAKSQFLKLGQKCRLLTVAGNRSTAATGPGPGGNISSYNLDDLIKATAKYEQSESANLSQQQIVYKSYKSELDLTKNLAYLDSFLNEAFEERGSGPMTAAPVRHKRAKSCSKSLHHPSSANQTAGHSGGLDDGATTTDGTDEVPPAAHESDPTGGRLVTECNGGYR
ncbi:filaggrin-2-like [Anopheles albimanus]|uniref:filaggrin-2-like n=1 Tax=Anopheles albimanus TaxID=7167 RepID=UPI00163ED6F4|nr:filaggrin-2-like [Anopheles albimanus]